MRSSVSMTGGIGPGALVAPGPPLGYAPYPPTIGDSWRRRPPVAVAPPVVAYPSAVGADSLPLPFAPRTCELHRGHIWRRVHRAEHDPVVLDIGDDQLAGVEFAPENLLGQGIFDEALNRPPQRPRAELRVVALL